MQRRQGKFTGWHATAILVAFFGVVATVNFTMAGLARANFSGVVVENSYVASQEFNGWLDQAERSQQLGWAQEVTWREDGRLSIRLDGAPVATRLDGEARHPLGRNDDLPLAFERQLDGSFLSDKAVPAGRWTLRLEATHGGDLWRAEEQLQ